MGCPHNNQSSGYAKYFRRDLVQAALAAGGVAAFAACIEDAGVPDVPTGVDDLSEVPERQFAWNDYLSLDPHENTVFPIHQLILLLKYEGDIPPEEADREAVEGAFNTIDRAYQRGNGGVDPYGPGGENMPGILYMMGYSGRYFDRFDEDLPSDIGFYDSETLVETLDEDIETDTADAALVLASDHAQVLLAIEMGLFGQTDGINGYEMEGTFSGVFDVVDRRTGFVGPTVPSRELDREDIPQRSPLAMGFNSGFADNQASETRVAFDSGPFEDGTTLQLSRLTLHLDDWYDHDLEERIDLMFSPEHSKDDVGEVGQFLGGESGLVAEMEEQMETHAAEEGVIGHTQKLAVSRDENFEPVILRRSEAVSTDEPEPGMNFTSVQRDLDDFVTVRQAMDEPDIEEDVSSEHDGILDYHTVERRGTYLIPPRSAVGLPGPTGV